MLITSLLSKEEIQKALNERNKNEREDYAKWRIQIAIYEEREKWMFRCLYVFVAGMAVAAVIFSFLDLLNSKQ